MLLPNCDRTHDFSSNSTLLTIFGGQLQDIEVFLTEERLPEGWESKVRKPLGLTFAAFNTTVIPLELQTDEKAAAKELAAKTQDQAE